MLLHVLRGEDGFEDVETTLVFDDVGSELMAIIACFCGNEGEKFFFFKGDIGFFHFVNNLKRR